MINEGLHAQDFYFCYSKDISDLLTRHEIYYILKARTVKDGKIFTLYEKTIELEEVLRIGK